MNSFSSMDEVQRWLFRALISEGSEVSPRGETTLELTPLMFTLERPRNRCIRNHARRWNMALAVGEFAWHVSASDELDFVAYYMNRWRQFVDNPTRVRGGCYGRRVFGDDGQTPSQWHRVLRLLEGDPSTRRAVLSFHDPLSVLNPTTQDVSCACTLQFLLRGGKLDAIGHMRSNDAVWGMPYDVFFHTMLQELAAAQLGVQLGRYCHMVGSMHVYARHLSMAREVVDSPPERIDEMPALTHPEMLPLFLECERSLRTTGVLPSHAHDLPGFWRGLLDVLVWHRAVKHPHEKHDPMLCDGPYARLTWERSQARVDRASVEQGLVR